MTLRALAAATGRPARVTVFSRAWFDAIRAHRNQPIRLGEDDGGECAVVWCAVDGVEVTCCLPLAELHRDEAEGLRVEAAQVAEDPWRESAAKDKAMEAA